ncbi:MAG: dihydroorotate dehydrogenase-like protein [Brooklawnia sp.]|jgi:dihydroorotate dehydrogenase (fumarate)
MANFDSEALRAAAESHRRKTEMGSSATDQLAPSGLVAPDLPSRDKADLRTRYMGLWLRNPVVASAGPLSQGVKGIKDLAAGGVGAIVMYSLFEEQIRHEAEREAALMDGPADSFAEALSYFPVTPSGDSGLTNRYLETLEKAAPAIDVPLIASLNGSTRGDWTHTARRMADAGAAGIELNVYYVPGDMRTAAREVEQRHLDILADVKSAVEVPVAMKLSPYFSSFGEFALELDRAGADALVLFNRYLQPDVDLNAMAVVPGFGLSHPEEAKLPRSWITGLHGRVKASLAATTGVQTSDDVVKYVLAGADVVMTTAALVRNGPGYAQQLVDGLQVWLDRKHLSLQKARGMLAVPDRADATDYARAGYVSGLERAKEVYAG